MISIMAQQYQYDKEGQILDVFGRYAIAVGYNMDGQVLIRPESLSLKLRTNWVTPSFSGNADQGEESRKNGIIDKVEKDENPNLAKILSIGDRITFDAVAMSDEKLQSPVWIASPGSVRVSRVCADTRTFTGYGKVIEVSTSRGVISFADKKVRFDLCAMFPDKVADVRRALRVGDLVSFIAVDEPDDRTTTQWRAISVERYRSERSRENGSVDSHRSPNRQTHSSSPMAFFPAESPPEVLVSNEYRAHRRGSMIGKNYRRIDTKEYVTEEFLMLPKTLDGYGRITYYGPRCSVLKDLKSHHEVFFFNNMVRYQNLRQGQMVYFDSDRSTLRANLGIWFDAKKICVLDRDEEARWDREWKRANGQDSDGRRSSSSSGHSKNGKRSIDTDSSRPPRKRHEGDKSGGNNDDDSSFEVDRQPFGDKVEKVVFDVNRNLDGSMDPCKNEKIAVTVAGDKRVCALGGSGKEQPKEGDKSIELDSFMQEEENYGLLEFAEEDDNNNAN